MEITPRQWLIALLIAGLAHAALAYALVQATMPIAAAPNGIRLELGTGGHPAPRGSDAEQGGGALRPVPAEHGNEITQALEPLGAEALSAELGSDHPVERLTEDRVETRPPNEQLVAKAAPNRLVPRPASKPMRAPRPELSEEPAPIRQVGEPPAASAHQQRQHHRKPSTEPPRRSTTSDDHREEAIATARAEVARRRSTLRSTSATTAPQSGRTTSSTPASTLPEAGHGGADGQHEGNRGRADGSDGGRGNGGSGNRPSGGGSSKADARNYYGRLATWLARHKRYPLQARRLGQEGTVKVTFTVSRSGRVLAKHITQSSGHPLLDREAQAMLDRASPLPRIPASLGRDSLTISLPVAFGLR
ncbi:MAG: TonB family protein [Gammaproteobacteria bacterium]|jgi:protein TonB|nr:TonB family protein [Gammaproteobacteria bacterium]